MNARLAVSLLAHAAAIVAANVLTSRFGLVPVGFGLMVTAGTYAAGLAFLARDFVQKHGGPWWAVASIAVGGLLSWWLASPGLAVASTLAFLAAETCDLAVYTPLRGKAGFVVAALVSNVVAAPVDTVAFLHLAGFPLTWQAVTGQFVGKVLWATVVPLAVYVGVQRALLRQPVHAEGA